jgi:cytochrome c oxidase subunit 2
MMPSLREADGGLRIDVSGEQWWWRVTYRPVGGEPVESANEIRLPRGERIEFVLSSPDVIHSFWMPSIGGKMDMIPGRINHLVLEPTQTGRYRGVCAEFCGTSHALMAFSVVVMEPDAFDAWLAAEAGPAAATRPEAAAGAALFRSYGCGGCHAIRGTEARGVIGPDLTHVGGRETIGAGILPNTPEAVARWIADPREIKPGAHMPGFGMAPERDIQAIAAYLGGLE